MISKNGLKLGDLEIKVPVFQGGMGVGVSLSKLAGAVAKAGGVGVISTAQIGFRDEEFSKHPLESNLKAIKSEIKKAREIAGGGVLGVNIMVATREYEKYVKAAVEAGIDMIISGAGLPMDLPGMVKGSKVKLLPIVSSKRALNVIMKFWSKKYNRLPDGIVVEGPMAGGHLGFSTEEIGSITKEQYEEEIKAIINTVKETDSNIPVIVGGGIFDKEDMERCLKLGADGVQVATRFVTTEECDAHENYKQAYINAKKEDVEIVKSPVGMPGRAIHNTFLDKVAQGERFMRGCRQCIKSCDPRTAPYCITEALINAVEGRLDEGLIFCGANVYKCDKMESVVSIMEEFKSCICQMP